jgi:hypothetical protein
MTTLLFNVVIGIMLASSMLMAGFRLGQRRVLGSLAKLVDEGSFKLHTADGRSASMRELLQALGETRAAGEAVSKPVVALAFVAASVALAVAFIVVTLTP